jgi:hypothetical protein
VRSGAARPRTGVDLTRVVPAALVAAACTVVLGLAIELVSSLMGAGLHWAFTLVATVAGLAGALALGRGGGRTRLVAHLLAPMAGWSPLRWCSRRCCPT